MMARRDIGAAHRMEIQVGHAAVNDCYLREPDGWSRRLAVISDRTMDAFESRN
jgi:hypothetical protein